MIDRERFKAALGGPDAGFDRAVDAALRRLREKEARPVMKKKISIGLLAAIIAILTLTGAALAVGLNLFDQFARRDERLARIAPEAALATETPGEVETEEIGKSAVEIVNAYYDGESLIVAYTEENTSTCEPFTPTAEELAKMEREDDGYEPFELSTVAPAKQAFIDAFKAGKPCGYVEYSVFASDHMYAGKDGEIELVPSMGDEMTLEDGRQAYLIEFDTPLPEAARDQEELELYLPILQFEHRQWFDGQHVYFLNGPLDSEARTYEWIDGNTYTDYHRAPERIGEAVATVKRSSAETRLYTGEGDYHGVPVHVEATATAVRAEVRLTSEGAALADPCIVHEHPDGGAEIELRYDFILTDENGALLRWDGQWVGDGISESAAKLTFEGVGKLPEELRLYIMKDGEERAEADSILLKPAD